MTSLANRYDAIRIALCVICILVIALNAFDESWGLWVTSAFGTTGLLAIWLIPQFLLPVLLPGRIWLLLGTVVYILVWVVLWSFYHQELAQYPESDRGWMTGALFMFANISFAIGLGIRFGARIGSGCLKWWKSIYGANAA